MSEGEKSEDDHKLPPTDDWFHVKKCKRISQNNDEKNDEKKYKCLDCGKEFSKKRIFDKHIKTHNKSCSIKSEKTSKKKK